MKTEDKEQKIVKEQILEKETKQNEVVAEQLPVKEVSKTEPAKPEIDPDLVELPSVFKTKLAKVAEKKKEVEIIEGKIGNLRLQLLMFEQMGLQASSELGSMDQKVKEEIMEEFQKPYKIVQDTYIKFATEEEIAQLKQSQQFQG